MAALIRMAQETMTLAERSDPESQVKRAFEAMGYVTQVLEQTRGGHEGVMQALREAQANNQRVVASESAPGPNWERLQPNSSAGAAAAQAAATQDSILKDELGRGELLKAAAADSVCCPHCCSLLPFSRYSAHVETWCPALHPDSDQGDQ